MDRANIGTQKKWDYLKKYLHAYTTIVSCYFRNFSYCDMFAGKGKYNGQYGSPLIALNLEFPFTEYIFIEQNEEKLQELKENITKLPNREAIVLRKSENEYKKRIKITTKALGAVDYIKNNFGEIKNSPCFIFLDPDGLELTMETVSICSQKRKVELLINFSVMGIIRNADRPKCHNLLTQYYGSEKWKSISKKGINRGELYAQLYITSLKQYFEFILHKVIKNEKNASLYYLIYATNNDKGFKIMKDVMNLKYEQSSLETFGMIPPDNHATK